MSSSDFILGNPIGEDPYYLIVIIRNRHTKLLLNHSAFLISFHSLLLKQTQYQLVLKSKEIEYSIKYLTSNYSKVTDKAVEEPGNSGWSGTGINL